MNNWIEEEKENPVINTVVLITDGIHVSCGWLCDKEGELVWEYVGGVIETHPNEINGDITHWMPLPKPPQRNG